MRTLAGEGKSAASKSSSALDLMMGAFRANLWFGSFALLSCNTGTVKGFSGVGGITACDKIGGVRRKVEAGKEGGHMGRHSNATRPRTFDACACAAAACVGEASDRFSSLKRPVA